MLRPLSAASCLLAAAVALTACGSGSGSAAPTATVTVTAPASPAASPVVNPVASATAAPSPEASSTSVELPCDPLVQPKRSWEDDFDSDNVVNACDSDADDDGIGFKDDSDDMNATKGERFVAGEYKTVSLREFRKIAKNPKRYEGKKIIIFGEVTQFDSNTGDEMFRASTGQAKKYKNYGFFGYSENTMILGEEKLLDDVVTGDAFKAYVKVVGSYDYSNTMGGSSSALQVRALKISVYDSKD